jgi:hypothetical protein
MSKPREENPELARVLSRVNALMKHDLGSPREAQRPATQELVIPEEPMPASAEQTQVPEPEPEVPVLTEVYEGEPPMPASHSLADFGVSASQEEVQDDEALEAIITELMPLIRAEVKKAVRQELVNMEKIVNHRLETEFIQTLMQRLRSEPAD